MRFSSPLCFIILFCLPSLVFCQHIVWISDKGAKWTELGLIGLGSDIYWQEGQGEKYREISRLENSSGITEVILDCPGRNCRFRLDKNGAFFQPYDDKSVWNLFLYGNFIPAIVTNVDFHIDDKKVVFTFNIFSKEEKPYYNIVFELENESTKEVIIPRNLKGEVTCVKADVSPTVLTTRQILWDPLKDGITLSGKYRLICKAIPSASKDIELKISVEEKVKKEEADRKLLLENRRKFLEERAIKVYDYCELMPDIILRNSEVIKSSFKKIVAYTPKGSIGLNIQYRFDTSGVFTGKVQTSGVYSQQLESYLKGGNNGLIYPPSIKNSMWVSSQCQTLYNLDWKTDVYRYRYNKNNIKPLNRVEQFPANAIYSHISQVNLRQYGVYSFYAKKTNLNDQSFYAINYKNFNNRRGPLNVFYSMLLPGAGTMRVTYNQNGTGRMVLFILSAGIAGITKYYSNEYYQKYLSATSQTDINYNYRVANDLQKVFLISGGLGACIYVYDFFHVFGRGIKNKAEQKRRKEAYMEKPCLLNQELQLKP